MRPVRKHYSEPSMSLVRRFAQRGGSPRFVALCLGLLSLPFVATTIVWSSTPPITIRETVEPVSFGSALLLALVPVTAASLVGGSLGGSRIREQPVRGLAFALLFAWPVAIATLPLLPALLGWPYRGAWFCFSACNPMVTADIPLSGLISYADSLLFDLWGPAEVAGVLALIAIVLARIHHRLLASAFTILAFVAVNFWTITGPGVLPAAIALIAGSVVWAAPYLVAEREVAEATSEASP